MHPVLKRNTFLVREKTGLFKTAKDFDILDPATGATILHCGEEKLTRLTKVLRITNYQRRTPFDVAIRTPEGDQIVRARRGMALVRSHVEVLNGKDEPIGAFHQKLRAMGSAFDVQDADGRTLCQLKGKWTTWEFRFLEGETELARVTKKWAGLGKELFTSADNYVLDIAPSVPTKGPLRQLMLAAVMCIDLVLKE